MATQMRQHPHSTAQLGGHPIHPMLIPFPIAFFIGALVTDIVLAATYDPFWARMSFYLICAGLAMAALAALAGLTDFLGDRLLRTAGTALHHMLGNVTVVMLEIVSLIVRVGPHHAASALPWGLVISAVVTLLLVYTGWLGGRMVYEMNTGMSDSPQ